jgi:hypothetical protein
MCSSGAVNATFSNGKGITQERLIRQLAVDRELAVELLAEHALIIGVYGHHSPGGEIGAAKDRAGPGGPPASSTATPDVPPGKLGL